MTKEQLIKALEPFPDNSEIYRDGSVVVDDRVSINMVKSENTIEGPIQIILE